MSSNISGDGAQFPRQINQVPSQKEPANSTGIGAKITDVRTLICKKKFTNAI